MRASHWFIVLVGVSTAIVLIPPAVVPRESQELLMVVWGMPFEDVLFKEGYARGFEERNPGWTVNYQRHNDVIEKYTAWHLQRRGADVMRLGIDKYHAMIRMGAIEPLDEFISDSRIGLSDEDIGNFPQAIWNELRIDGRIYALPSDNAQYGVYYNRAIFDAWNAAHPEAPLEYPSAAWKWDDLLRAADLLTRRDDRGVIEQYGVALDLWAWPFFAFLKQAGGEMWDAEETTALVNSGAGVEALEFIVRLIPPDAPIRALEHADSGASPRELFKVGRVAILLDGSWSAPAIEEDAPGLDFAIAPLPHHREKAVVTGSVLWAISSHSEHKEKAFEMIRWMTGFEGSQMYWRTLRVAPPANLAVIESEAFRETPGFIDPSSGERRAAMPREKYEDRAAWLRYAVTVDPETGESPAFVPAAEYQDDLQRAVTRAMVEAVRGEKSAAAALDDAVADVHAIIDRDRRSRGLPAVVRGAE